jgi:hypothetical protein
MIPIQYGYDLQSSSTLDLRLTAGTRNDRLDSKENTHDKAENDLFIPNYALDWDKNSAVTAKLVLGPYEIYKILDTKPHFLADL